MKVLSPPSGIFDYFANDVIVFNCNKSFRHIINIDTSELINWESSIY